MKNHFRFLHAAFVIFLLRAVAFADPFVDAYLANVNRTQISELAQIRVDGKAAPQTPVTASDLPAFSTWLIQSLRHCASPCELRLNAKTQLKLETPPLGEGERGVVFRIAGQTPAAVIKISKPELKSLAILRAEALSAKFWADHTGGLFEVPRRLTGDDSGLFATMQEVKGESLTKSLFRMGLLQMNPLTNEVHADKDKGRLESADARKIWSAIGQMIQVVKTHPQMKTSLSPNNIFVTWSKGAKQKIDHVSLIDFGIDGTGDGRYFELTSLSEYLSLSAIKIKGYLEKPGFTEPDLWQVQEETRKKRNIPPLYDVTSERPLLEELARKILPMVNVRKMSLDRLLAIRLNSQNTFTVEVNGEHRDAPKTVFDLAATATWINDRIAKTKPSAHLGLDADSTKTPGASPNAHLKLNGEVFRLQLPPLGMGDRGVVYGINGTDEVLKLPKSNLISVLTLMNESAGYSFWYEKSREKGSRFSVPLRRYLSPVGAYSVMARDHGEPLTKSLVRMGVLTFDPASGLAIVNQDKVAAMPPQNREKVERAILQILQIIKSNPSSALSISPNNLHVNYADPAKTLIADISGVVLIDVGLSSRSSDKFDKVISLESYLELSRDRLQKYLRVGYADDELKSLNQHGAKAMPAQIPQNSGIACEMIFAVP